jgi:ATP-binding cassette, subfamily B, bacterial
MIVMWRGAEVDRSRLRLASLTSRLYDPASGSVRIDGIDVRDLRLTDLASIVGVVSQETYLLHATVRENLRYARPEASDAEIEHAVRIAPDP